MTEQHDDLADRLDQLRADTPGAGNVAHFNNAGSALPTAAVTDTVVQHLRLEAMTGGYEAHDAVLDRIEGTRASVGRLLGVDAQRVAFGESATHTWGRALGSILHSGHLRHRDEVLVSCAEYASNVLPLLQLQRSIGIRVRFVPDGPDGALDVDALASMLSVRTKLVAITHAASQNGVVNDAWGVGQELRDSDSDAWYLLDGCQSIGQLPVSLPHLGADFVTGTGRKFLRGPRGTGFLAASQRAVEELEPFPLDLHSATWVSTGTTGDVYEMSPGAMRYEAWERSYACVLGLGVAVDYALDLGVDRIERRLTGLADELRRRLAEVSGVEVRDRGSRRSAIVTFSHASAPATHIKAALSAAGINVSISSPFVAQRDFSTYGEADVVRASPHVYNSAEEIDRLMAVVTSSVA